MVTPFPNMDPDVCYLYPLLFRSITPPPAPFVSKAYGYTVYSIMTTSYHIPYDPVSHARLDVSVAARTLSPARKSAELLSRPTFRGGQPPRFWPILCTSICPSTGAGYHILR